MQCRKKGAANYGNKSESVAEAQLDEKCWDTHKQVGMKNKGGRQVPDCRPKESQGVAEAIISNDDSALDLLELNIFKDLIGEHSLSNYDEDFAQSPEWQKVVARWAPLAEKLHNAVIRLHNAGKKISSQEARAITDTAYDGSDVYNDPASAAMDLPRIYKQQYNAISQFIQNISKPNTNMHEQGVAEGADDKFSVADKVEQLVDQYRLYDKRGWTDLFAKLAGRKLAGAEIYREMEYASKFLQLLDSIRMRSDYRGQQDPREDQELIDLSNQWLDLFNKATGEFKGISGQGVAEGYYKDPDGDDESAEDREDKKDNEKRRREEDGMEEGLHKFVTPQATAQDPGLEREKDVDVIIFGRMPQDFTYNLLIEALEAVLPREYPPGSSQNTQGVPSSPAERIGQQIVKDGGAVVTTKPLSIAQKLVKEFQSYGIKCRINAPGLEEGDNPWGNQGNFAGDTSVNVGGVSMKNIQTGDTVKYLGQPSKVVAMSKDRKYSRITITKGMGGVTQDVLTSDLQQLGRGMAEADEQPLPEPFKTGYPRVNNPKILGTQNRAKSAYHPPAKPPIKKLDKPLPESTGSRYHEQLAQQLPPGLQSEDDILNAAWPMAVNDLGQKAAKYNFNYDEDFLGDLISAYHSIQKSINEAGQNYHANRTGFARGTRDPEGQDPQVGRPVWGLKINGKVWSKDGKDVTFTSKEAALKTRNAILKNRPDLEIGLVTRGGMTESDNLTEYGAPGSRALGTANFALLHRAYVNKRPRLSRNLRLEFGPNQAVDLDDDDIEAIAGYYDTLPADQDRYNFVYDIMSRGDKFTALLRKLGRRGELLEQDSKKKSNSPLDRKDVKSATLNTALRQAYAKYPQANSDIEALALHDLNYQQNTSQDLSTQAKTNQRQDSVDNQLKDLARKQSFKISDLDQENDELSAELDKLNQEINTMSQQVGTTPKDSDKPSDKPSVINLNVAGRGEKSQQRQADVKQRDMQKSEPAVTTSPAMGQVAQSLANPPAPTIDVIDTPAVALPTKMGAAPAVPDSDSGEQLNMFGPEPEAVPAKSVNTVSEPPAEVPSTMAATDADEPDELPANVSDLEKARRTRDQLRQATRDQALNAIKTGTFESGANRSLFSSLLVMESAKENHRNLVCEMCGRTAADHPFKHPFKVSSK